MQNNKLFLQVEKRNGHIYDVSVFNIYFISKFSSAEKPVHIIIVMKYDLSKIPFQEKLACGV